MAKNVFKRVVEYGDGWMPNRVTPEQVKQGRAAIDELADAAGRDPSSINVTVFGQPADKDLIGQFKDAGADRIVLRLETANEEKSLATLESMAKVVF
jgi:alkanesulfonate monooxygenase SsuD/methylene tetrahydromethanopterin reductase-like flavin-dependent oxidoreductase (luciferase family)